jgi:hypothetical protein
VAVAASVALAFVACSSSDDRLPPRPAVNARPDAGTDDLDGGVGGGPPAADAGGLCGNEIHQAVVDAPNLYFVLDASGSMATSFGSGTRYAAVRGAVVDLVRKLGPLVNVGAALFPIKVTDEDTCHVGGQVLPVKAGDPITGEDGPTTIALRQSTLVTPKGGTPVSATLTALAPTLTALKGRTFVVIATDGAPNCNESASCGAEACMGTIEGQCDPGTNCCAPGGTHGPAFCVDEAATVAAITELRAAGLEVIVIGIPGSEAYAGVLDVMAKAGGSQRAASPFYYPVTDLDGLAEALSSIASVAVSCDFALVEPPAEEGMTNVYLDQQMLPYDVPDGWIWKPPSTVTLLGDACDRLKGGKVAQVQIVSGCPTGVPK